MTESQKWEQKVTEEQGTSRKTADYLYNNEAQVRCFIENARIDLKFLRDSLKNEMQSMPAACMKNWLNALMYKVQENDEKRGA